ncbi:efflux RND transporter periplasmic adaptor subunit [Achromobacter xylosoxidans]|uniref:efflux RND transporter periplasmic adaptor subunit n=1 Tax=Alcaligenes xylosoxydans xylosoxydans TaxID=85698 RepID=UPI0008A4D4AB|nr:efflux RND transporter periplasmic adaptor subunit [Achromobacter xylosoxidans]OFU79321.1 efflux transporter periplasmic adaptor subunit [Achromobacter xylosoxidans]
MTMHTALSAFTRPALAVALSAACLLALALPGPALADAGHGQAPAGSDTRVAADSTATPQDHDEDKITLSPEQIQAADLGIETAGPARLETTAQFPGEIKFNADRTAHVVPRLAGVVQEVSADLGQQVRKGDLLAALSSTALSELRSEWLAASKRRDLAAATHQRELKLWREKVSAEQDYQQARTALQEAQIAVQNAAQKLAAIGAPPQSKDLSRLEIRAPFDGVVVEKHIALGEALADTASIFTLSDLRTVWAEFVIAPKDLQDVRVGEAASVASAAFSGQARGKVSYIGSLLGQQTRTATARVTLDNPDMAWRPGLFVSVNVVTSSADVPVAVAADAVQTVENESVVYVEAPGGFLAQPVKLGRASGEQVEVLSGLAAGTRYVTRNAFVLKAEQGKASASHAH